MNQIPVTALVLTKNEEVVIARTVESLRQFEQVIVVDSLSSDRTVDIAVQCGAEIVEFKWSGRYPKKKQWALEHHSIRNDWVLFVDADEAPSSALVDEIAGLGVGDGPTAYAAYDIPLAYWFGHKQLRHGHRVFKRSLVDRRRCAFPVIDDLAVSNMWEVEGHYQPQVSGTVGTLRSELMHRDLDPLYDYISRHNRYSDWEAFVRTHSGVRKQIAAVRSSGGVKFQRLPFKPLIFFLYSFLYKKGFLDGRQGFDYAIAHSFYFWQIDAKTRYDYA